MNNRNLARRAPFGVSILIATIPGPCTTFDDVTAPSDDAAAPPSEASTLSCTPGLDLHFYAVPAADNCNARLNEVNVNGDGCCEQANACANDDACAGLLHCLDDCYAPDAAVPGSSTCLRKCDETWDSGGQLHANGVYSPIIPLSTCAKSFDAAACVFE